MFQHILLDGMSKKKLFLIIAVNKARENAHRNEVATLLLVTASEVNASVEHPEYLKTNCGH